MFFGRFSRVSAPFDFYSLRNHPSLRAENYQAHKTTSRDSYAAWLLERGETHHKIQRVSTTPTKPTLSREINFAVQR